MYGLGEVNFAAPPPLEGPENSFLVGGAPPLARPPLTEGGEATQQLGVINRLGLSEAQGQDMVLNVVFGWFAQGLNAIYSPPPTPSRRF